MSMALTVCAAAQPLMASAADPQEVKEAETPADDTVQSEETAEKNELASAAPAAPENDAPEETSTKETFGPDVDVKYDPDTKEETDGSTTIEGDVIRNEPQEETPSAPAEDSTSTPSEDEPGKLPPEQNPSEKDEGQKIGDAEKTETPDSSESVVKPDPGAEPLPDTTRPSTSETEPDGSTTIRNPTVTPGTETTTTTGSGHAEADTTETTETPKNEIDLKDELGENPDISWDVKKDTAIGGTGYKVDEVRNDGNKQTLTLIKETEEHGEMTPDDIAKLVDAEKTMNPDGSYSLTRTEKYLDENGNEQTRTTYITVKDSSVTIKTTTVLTVTREKVEHTPEEAVSTSNDFKLPDVKVSGDSGSYTIDSDKLDSLIEKDKQPSKDGTKTIYKVTEDGKEYTITVDEKEAGKLTADEIAAKLGSDFKAEGDKVYYIGNGEHAELSVDQTNVIRRKLSIKVEVREKTAGTETKVEDGKDPETEKNNARTDAVKNALNNAVTDMLKEKQITQEEADALMKAISEAKVDIENGGVFKTSVNGRNFELNYTAAGTDIKETPRADTSDKTDIKDTTVTGTAYVINGVSYWRDDSGTIRREASDTTGNLSGDYTRLPDGIDPEKVTNLKTDSKNRITDYTFDGKTYHFDYTDSTELNEATRMELEKLAKDNGWTIDKVLADMTTVKWTVKEADSTMVKPADETYLGEIKDENGWTETLDENGKTYTISYNDKNGKEQTISGLTRKADGSYFKEDGNTTTVISVKDGQGLTQTELENLLKQKFDDDTGTISHITQNEDGTVSFQKNGVTYTVTYEGSRKTLDIETTTNEKKSFGKESDYLNWVNGEITKAEDNNEILKIGNKVIDRNTSKDELLRLAETVVRYDEMSEQELIDFLTKQKETLPGVGQKDHVDLDVSADMVDNETKDKYDAVIINPTFVINSDAEDLVKNGAGSQNSTTVKLQENVSYDSKSKYNEYQHEGWGDSIDESKYYHVSGQVAYGQLFKDTSGSYGSGTFLTEADAKAYAKSKGLDPDKLQFVQFYTSQDNGHGHDDQPRESYWKVYEHTAQLSAYGYMSANSNTCRASGYDLLLDNLTLVKDKVYAQGKDTCTWSNTLTHIRNDTARNDQLLMDINKAEYLEHITGKTTYFCTNSCRNNKYRITLIVALHF